MACAVGNNQGNTGTPHPSTYPQSYYYPQQYCLPSGPTYSNGDHINVPFTQTHSTFSLTQNNPNTYVTLWWINYITSYEDYVNVVQIYKYCLK